MPHQQQGQQQPHHLELLRTEYIQLQAKHAELQRRYDVLEASVRNQKIVTERGSSSLFSDLTSSEEPRNFVHRLVDIVAHLYNKDLYSDITVHCDGHQIRSHRFVLAARTDHWGDLSSLERLEWGDQLAFNVGQVLIRWMYTDQLDERLGNSILLSLFQAAIEFELDDLKSRCEALLIANLDLDNCVRVYHFAEQHSIDRLRDSCSEMVAARWKEFTPDHFTGMEASFLYKMLKRRSKPMLSSIVGLRREDVLFLFLIEHDSELNDLLNQPDPDAGIFPLELALFHINDLTIAKTLVSHGSDPNMLDQHGQTYLWKAIQAGSLDVCEFLVENGANVNYVNETNGETLLHVLAKSIVPPEIKSWADTHIARFELNALDSGQKTPLMLSIQHQNCAIFELLLAQEGIDLERRDAADKNALEYALLDAKSVNFAEPLAKNGANLNATDGEANTLFHKAVTLGNLMALQFLAKHGADVNRLNRNGSAPLHLFMNQQIVSQQSGNGLPETQLDILKILLKAGADPTLCETCSGLTPVHFAVDRDKHILEILLGFCLKGMSLSVLDNDGRSPLWRALLAGKFDAACLLLSAGADVNEKSVDAGDPLLIRAIGEKRDDIARFLLENRAIAALTSPDGRSCLQLAVEQGMTPTVDQLCKLGADPNQVSPKTGLVPLWTALNGGDFGTAEVLVANGCDMEAWTPSDEDGLDQTLLHRAIDRRNKRAAVFLIKNGCNVNVMQVVKNAQVQNQKPNAAEIFAASRQTPLHMCVQWGLSEVSRALVSNLNCKIDAQDADGRTAAHIAIIEQDQPMLELLLSHPDPSFLSIRDRFGQTPLALAMTNKCIKAAEAICKRLPHAAVQTNGSGENLLHVSIKNNDFESVLFLLGIQVDVNIPVQDQSRNTPLCLCADRGTDLLCRNLILAGAQVNVQNAHGETPLALAARCGNFDVCRALLENGANPNIVDVDGNNALNAAVIGGQVQPAQLLLQESSVDYFAVNKRQQNVLHLCAINVGLVSAELFLTVMEAHPDFPLEMPDTNGNTMFFLAYLNGNAELCRMALRDGCCMGVMNSQGQTVFNIETPSKQLLFGLLEGLEKEPRWAEGDLCSECVTRFTLTMRKHHCRHCGRLVCAKCSEQQLLILKYNISKPSRVCQICYDLLTIGGENTVKQNGGGNSAGMLSTSSANNTSFDQFPIIPNQ